MARHGLVLAALLVSGCGWLEHNEASPAETQNKLAEKREHHEACASAQTAGRLKELAFDEATRVRGAGAPADDVAGRTTARMEDAAVLSRDEQLNVTTCSGRLMLELPASVGGERRIAADVRYAAQNATDGSGMVYQMEGAEALVRRLAAIGGVAVAAAQEPSSAPPRTATAPATEPPVQAAPPVARPQASANPSFNCRSARSRSERRVCGSPALAASDRQMSAIFYSALADADPSTRRRLTASRDRFLAFRERCGSDACIAQAYSDRIDEIRDIAGAGD